MQRVSLTSPFLASVFTFVTAFTLGCVITVGKGDDSGLVHECGSLLANNDENCVCLPGYERCNPNDPADTDCCEKEGKGGECEANSYYEDGNCYCNPGYAWCTDDPADLSCCEDPGQTSQGTTTGTGSDSETGEPTGGTTGSTTEPEPTTSDGTTGQPEECPNAVDPPATCDPDTDLAFCTNSESVCEVPGTYYSCVGGVWVEDSASADEQCQFDGYDFSYGCFDTEQGVIIECGTGSGTPCQGNTATCLDSSTWQGCQWGKATEVDCFYLCTEIGYDGALYDYGDCQIQDGEAVCACCDIGDEGCEMGETDGETG